MRRRWLGLVVLAALALHARSKAELGTLDELLWICHVTSTVIAFGLLTANRFIVATGFAVFAAAGVPPWLLDVITTGATTPSSVLTHLVSPLAAGWALVDSGRAPWSRWVPAAGVGLYLVTLVASRLLTGPAHNVNMVYAPWGPAAQWIPNVIWSALANTAILAAGVTAVDAAARKWWFRDART